jgi:hypothetical protein
MNRPFGPLTAAVLLAGAGAAATPVAARRPIVERAIAVPVSVATGETISATVVDKDLIARIPSLRPVSLPDVPIESEPLKIAIPAGSHSIQFAIDGAPPETNFSPSIDLGALAATPIVSGVPATEYGARPLFTTRLQMVTGPFDGDIGTTAIELDQWRAPIIAETPRAVWFVVPEGVPAGAHVLHVHERTGGAAIPVATLNLAMSADQLSLLRGQSTKFQATVSGPDKVPAKSWKAGDPTDMTYLDEVKRLSPGFKVPKPGEPGVVFFAVENASRQTISISPAKNEAMVYVLDQSAFAGGPFTHNGVAKSKQTGNFNINGLVVAFLDRITGDPLPPGHTALPLPPEPPAAQTGAPRHKLVFTFR